MTETHDGARFIWRDKDCTAYGDLGGALCKLGTEQDAREFWDAYVAFLNRPTARLSGGTPESVAAANIGYLMGYYGPEERQRVYGLFPQASHPIFGRFETEPSAEQALEAGKRAALGEFKS